MMQLFLDKIDLNKRYVPYFDGSELGEALYNPETKVLNLSISVQTSLPYGVYRELVKKVKNYTKTEVDLRIIAESSHLDFLNISSYVNFIARKDRLNAVVEGTLQYNDDVLNVLCIDDIHLERVSMELKALQEGLEYVGIKLEPEALVHYSNPDLEVIEKVAAPKIEQVERKSVSRIPRRKGNKSNYNPVKMAMLTEEAHDVCVEGKIFDVSSRETRTGSFAVNYSFSDGESAITIMDFADTEDAILKKGKSLKVYGHYSFDARYARDYIFRMDHYEEIGDIFKRYDYADEKRVEFHMHTNNSEMDGISDASEYLKQAFEWKHPGMVLMDHVGVQAYPKAYKALKGLRKDNPDHDFRLAYGVEMNLAQKELNIASSTKGELLHEGSYVVFDLETTGLSVEFDHIIEFGGVLIENGKTIKSKQFFIKPPVKVSSFISKLTGINDSMLANAKPISEAMVDMLDFIGDHTLVAHNASFDMDFIQQNLRNLNMPEIDNAVVDTLELSRMMFEGRRAYRLGAIARLLKITYDDGVAHRADYDAEVLSLVFLEMLRNEQLENLKYVKDLQSLNSSESYAKGRPTHVSVIAKNQKGLKNIYELITLSHTKFLAQNGSAVAQPRIIKEELDSRRENLLLGAGCSSSDVFENAANKSREDLDQAISYYDYIEIMPLNYYSPQIESGMIASEERLIEVIHRIIESATRLNKIIIGSGNVHYNHPNQKVMRDVYISAQGLGGARHPLYIFNNERRASFVAPDQHFRNTQDMLSAFSYLGDSDAYNYVIKNPKELLATIEEVAPVPNKLYTPKLENSDELLKEIVYKNAYAQYGNPLPELVSERIERELKSIIGHGYGVIYYISHLLVKKSLNDGYLVGSRGSVGSSLVATMAEITEVNPLAPHYVCTSCHHNEFFLKGEYASGFDLVPKACPHCGASMLCDGQDIPFETFLGFEGDKVPDIDLNFSGDYQEHAHAYTKEIFGDDYVYRAGTISTVANKTAFGYVLGYNEAHNMVSSNAWNTYLASGSEGVKRTTGQHPGGIIVVPDYMEVHDFTPIQYPANNKESSWYTTHFEFHDIDDNVLKLDILGHVDPTAMKLLEKLTGVDINTVPMNDAKTLSLFGSTEALGVDDRKYHEVTGGLGLPEFGTPFVRQMLEATKPDKFSDLVQISGLSHGTDVWRNNAEDLIKQGLTLDEVIGCRDDIMTFLMQAGLENKESFDIMESVRKGKGLKPEWIESMGKHKVPDWYVDSCLKIKYMFPKAHAAAYVMMAVRVAWFKVYYPLAYYAVYFTLRSNAYEIETMTKDLDVVLARLNGINSQLRNYDTAKDVTPKEKNLVDTLEVTSEMMNRGFVISPIDLMVSHATEWRLDPRSDNAIIPPFNVVDGLGNNVAAGIVSAREEREFISKRDLITRGGISAALVKKLDDLGVTEHLQESNQMSLF